MSHKPEDPKKWVNLNWKKDHLLFHYKSNKRKTSLRIHNRDIMTMLQSANQCIEVRKYIEVGVTPCYLCGQPITETDSMNTVGGYKCEHIIPEYNLSMLTGLPNRLYKQEYKALMKRKPGGEGNKRNSRNGTTSEQERDRLDRIAAEPEIK